MNRYGQMALDHNRRHRPSLLAQVPDPETFFAQAGEAIAAEVAALRDEILGPVRAGENPEEYRTRSYQARTAAEELILSQHHLFQADPDDETSDQGWESDPDLDRHYQNLAAINETINTPL
ncbi:MAG: hypothetical protein ACT4OV_08245 [Microthrixaceae bacterium]